jgi:hypothetical protein
MTTAAIDRARQLVRWQALTVGLTLLCALMAIAAIERVRNDNAAIILLFCLNTGIAAHALAYASVVDGVSLRLVFWFYNLFFLALVPFTQYLTGSHWILDVSDSSVLWANVYILLYQILFLVAYPYGTSRGTRAAGLAGGPARYISGVRVGIAAALSAGVAIAFAVEEGYSGFGSLSGEVFGYTGIRASLGGFVVRPVAFFLLPLAILWWRIAPQRREHHHVAVGLATVAALLFNSPLSGTRFYVFAIFFGLFVFLYSPGARNPLVFLTLMVVGIFAGYGIQLVPEWLFLGQRDLDFSLGTYLYQGHFDGFENFVHGIDFVRDRGIVWGWQLLGALAFWVPRTLWPDKPIGTAAFVARDYLATNEAVPYTNLAAPFIEEAYVNFGLVGLVALTAVLALAFGYLDARYRCALVAFRLLLASGPRSLSASFVRALVLYPVLLGLSLFLLRGDMLSGVAYSTGVLASYELVSRVLLVRGRDGQTS